MKMVHKHVNPLHHIKVGTPEKPATEAEIIDVQEKMNNMQTDSGIVTNERVELDQVKSNKIIDAEPYLSHLEKRVMTDSGVPETLFGRGSTANRSTSDNQTSEMNDRIKSIQKTIGTFFDFYIIKDLLLEGGYDPITNPDDMVRLKFHDNDLASRIKAETHAIYKFEHNAITEEEMRAELGKDPVADLEGLSYRLKGHFETENAILIEQAKAGAKASTSSSSTTTTKKSSSGTKETDNKQTPSNTKKSSNSTEYIVIGLISDIFDFEQQYYGGIQQGNTPKLLRSIKTQIDFVIDSTVRLDSDADRMKQSVDEIIAEIENEFRMTRTLSFRDPGEVFNETYRLLETRIVESISNNT